VVYHDHPVSMDEYLPWFQARVFAAGRLTGELPPPLLPWLLPRGFVGQFFEASMASGRVVPIHWPGLALLMTPFTWLHAPWLLNPVIAGVGLLLLGYVARRTLGDEDSAGWACWLALASPAFVVNAFSYYSMNAHLVANLAYVALLLERTPRRLAAAGAVGSLALVLNQPLPHFLFAVPWIVWLAWRPGRLRNLTWLAVGYLPLSLLLGFGWIHLRSTVRHEGTAAAATADATRTVLDQTIHIVERVLHPPTLELMSVRLLGYFKLWNWAAPALPLLAFLGYRACRGRPLVRVVASSAILTIVGYWFTPPNNTQGHGWGFRYFHSAWWVLPLFAAALVTRWHGRREEWTRVLALVAITGLLVLVPLHVVQVERFIARHLAQDFPEEKVDALEIHLLRVANGYYAADLVQNDPFLRGRVVRMVSLGPEADLRMLRRNFPGARLVREDERGQVWRLPGVPP
jgi:hypothetical protein